MTPRHTPKVGEIYQGVDRYRKYNLVLSVGEHEVEMCNAATHAYRRRTPRAELHAGRFVPRTGQLRRTGWVLVPMCDRCECCPAIDDLASVCAPGTAPITHASDEGTCLCRRGERRLAREDAEVSS